MPQILMGITLMIILLMSEAHTWSDNLTQSCLEIYLTSVVWTGHTFENNLEKKHESTKYL